MILRKLLGVAGGLVLIGALAGAPGAEEMDAVLQRFDTLVRKNLDNAEVMPSAEIDATMSALAGKPLGERVAAWARRQLELGRVRYVFGRAPGGYVTEGRLCQDFATDCVLFMFRTTELARSTTAEEAVQFAFGTRFYGATIDRVVSPDGRVDYDDASHHQFAEDLLTSGVWGEDVTAQCGSALRDAVGSSRVPADTLHYLPKDGIDYTRLQSGDIVWFVGDESRPGAMESRIQGTLIHHLGILVRNRDEVSLVHPAAVPLPEVYERTGLVEVPLRTYLARVDRFKGIVVTRLVDL